MVRAAPYYQHPSVYAVARYLIDKGYAREGGVEFLRRCHRIRLEVTGGALERERVMDAVTSAGYIPDDEGAVITGLITAVRDSATTKAT